MSAIPIHQMEASNGLTWERVPCPLCKARNEELVFTRTSQPDGNVFRLVCCCSCGLGYVNPRPDSQSISQFYPQDYRPYQPPEESAQRGSPSLRDRLEQRVLERSHGYPVREPAPAWERWLSWVLARWVGPGRDSLTSLPYHGEGRLLDFGCGSGWFAERMRRRGWSVEGIDFSPHAARQAEQTFGFRVHVGSLPHPDIPDGSFDLINMGSVLEHVHRPHQIIEAASKALRPGGMLAISVPNFESWGMRRFGPNSFLADIPRHLLHFSPRTMRRLLEGHGLEVREVRMLHRVSWMRRTLRSVWEDSTRSAGSRWFARLASCGILCSLLTRWTVWRGAGDFFLTLACKPG